MSRLAKTPEHVDAMLSEGRYDRLVCGSDQVWLINGNLPFDRTYFLGVGQGVSLRRVSYAPSAGNIESYGADSERVRELVHQLNAVSVRDQNTLKLINDLGVNGVQRVVDPSLLADFTPMIGPRPYDRDYIAVVGGTNPATERLVRATADRRKLAVVAVGTQCSSADTEKRFVDAGDWVTWLAHARGVITSLFHGAAVSIALRRPFLAIDAGGRAFKLTDLLDRFGLGDNFLSVRDAEYPVDDRWLDMNYDQVETVIQVDVKSSREFLRGALDA